MRKVILVAILITLLSLALTQTRTLAATPTPNEVEAVARTLYCPLCVGQRLDSCEIPLCQDMKREIAQMLAKGRTPEEIRAYFVEQYGPVVLGEPPRKGINWLAWVIPIIVLVAAVGYAGLKVRQWSQERALTGESIHITEHGEVEDEYTSQVDRELSQLE